MTALIHSLLIYPTTRYALIWRCKCLHVCNMRWDIINTTIRFRFFWQRRGDVTPERITKQWKSKRKNMLYGVHNTEQAVHLRMFLKNRQIKIDEKQTLLAALFSDLFSRRKWPIRNDSAARRKWPIRNDSVARRKWPTTNYWNHVTTFLRNLPTSP